MEYIKNPNRAIEKGTKKKHQTKVQKVLETGITNANKHIICLMSVIIKLVQIKTTIIAYFAPLTLENMKMFANSK